MVQSPSWEANWFAASQKIPRISRNPKVHYRTHKHPPPFSTLGQPNPVHIRTSHLLEIHPNIIHPSTSRSPQWSPSLRFPQQDPIHPFLLTHTCRMSSQSHQLDALTSQMYFWNKTLHVLDSSSVHHQEFFTVDTAMVYVIHVCWQLASRIRMELLILFASCQQTCVTHTITVCTVKKTPDDGQRNCL